MIDPALVSVVATILSLPFLGNTDQVRLSGGLYNATACGQVSELPQETLDLVKVRVQAATVCKTWVYGIENGLKLAMVDDRVETEHTSSQKSITLEIDDRGFVVWPMAPDALAWLLIMVLAFPFCLVRWGKTPGKHVMGLILSRPIAFCPAFLRETLRLWPIHLVNLATLTLPLYGPLQLAWVTDLGVWVVLGPAGLVFIVSLGSHLLRWRSRMPWDGVVGTQVLRRREQPF